MKGSKGFLALTWIFISTQFLCLVAMGYLASRYQKENAALKQQIEQMQQAPNWLDADNDKQLSVARERLNEAAKTQHRTPVYYDRDEKAKK
jgi:hypothetical protein